MAKLNILFGPSNSSGLYLETALGQIIEDLETKNVLMADLNDAASNIYKESNSKVISLLNDALMVQENTMRHVSAVSHAREYTSNYDKSKVTAYPMSYCQYLSYTDSVAERPANDSDGMYLVFNIGTEFQSHQWKATANFERNYTLV